MSSLEYNYNHTEKSNHYTYRSSDFHSQVCECRKCKLMWLRLHSKVQVWSNLTSKNLYRKRRPIEELFVMPQYMINGSWNNLYKLLPFLIIRFTGKLILQKLNKCSLTVAGEATSRSMGSKIRLICGDIWMISPLMRQSFLLSSSTVFMFSIHTASTGPSKISHFLSGLWWGGSGQSFQTHIEQSNFNFSVCAVAMSQKNRYHCTRCSFIGALCRQELLGTRCFFFCRITNGDCFS